VSNYIQGNVVMGSKDLSDISNYAELHLQHIRQMHVTIEVLDKYNNVVETIQGMSTGGSINLDGDSLIRRTGSLSLVLNSFTTPNRNSLIWMTNKMRVYIGIADLSSTKQDVTHFCLGTYYISEPKVQISSNSNSVDITLTDNMMRWESIELEDKMIIEADTPLHTAVTALMNRFGEWNTEVQFTDLKVPYKLEFNEGETIINILTKLRDLYMDWECYYDIDGTFVFKKMLIQREDGEPIAWRFQNHADLIIDFSSSFSYVSVKNRVLVIGQMDEKTGLTPKAEATIVNEESPFHESVIDTRSKVIVDSSYGTAIQCESRAKHELFKSSTFQEQVSISTVPIYYLDANDLIQIYNSLNNELEIYVIDSISIGLGLGDEMKINCHKVYYNHFDIGGSLGDYQASADIVIHGIMNYGWLSLPEQRIKDFLGIEGSGNKLVVNFEYDGLHGVTAYITGFFGESNQSLTIDLADIAGEGENGDNGFSKADYSDRILGHEMLHAVMNDVYGVMKTTMMADWFCEGLAEFIHGADERVKAIIVEGGAVSTTLLNGLSTRAVELLNGAVWKTDTKDYAAGYIAVRYLNSRLKSGKTMKDFMWSMKDLNASGYNIIKDAIVLNTNFSTYAEFVSNFTSNVNDFIRYTMRFDIGTDEIDTGSIAGSDYGYEALNAEKVFDNSKAVQGVASLGFEVEFKRP
jgi:hypothetical protein